MVVLVSNTRLGIRHRAASTVDTHGSPAAGALEPMQGPWPGYRCEYGDGGWTLGLDPQAGPIRSHDVVVEPGTGRTWLVLTAELESNPAAPVVDWWQIQGREQVTGGTEPGGPQFAAGGTG